MIGDKVSTIATRRPDAYASSSFCERCGQIHPLARLVQAFSRPINICRECRFKITGVVDRRGLPDVVHATATIATAPQLERPRIAGLLAAGPLVDVG